MMGMGMGGMGMPGGMPGMGMVPQLSPQDYAERDRAMGQLPMTVRYKMELLFATGRVFREEIETCCIESLRDFDEQSACEIVDKFAEADFQTIKSKTAFFIGILKRYGECPTELFRPNEA